MMVPDSSSQAFENSTAYNMNLLNSEEMVLVKGGTFQMGSNDGKDDEQPVHAVTVSDYYIDKYEVTYEEFDAYCNATGKALHKDLGLGRGKRPLVFVSWYHAVEFCNWKSEQHNLKTVYTINGKRVSADWDANGFRLPTEAEWEYAARERGKDVKWAGTSSEKRLPSFGNFCDRKCSLDWARMWYKDGYKKTAPVGSFTANGLGLFDMSGNVSEWCWDWYDNTYYSNNANTSNPTGLDRDSYPYRVARGGSWYGKTSDLRCTSRNGSTPSYSIDAVGFRLVRAGV